MFVVTMEAQVPPEQEERLTRAFAHVMKHRPDSVVQSMLMRDNLDPTLWRVLTVWDSREAADAYYVSNTNLPGAYVFHLSGLVPTATSSELIAYGGGMLAQHF